MDKIKANIDHKQYGISKYHSFTFIFFDFKITNIKLNKTNNVITNPPNILLNTKNTGIYIIFKTPLITSNNNNLSPSS